MFANRTQSPRVGTVTNLSGPFENSLCFTDTGQGNSKTELTGHHLGLVSVKFLVVLLKLHVDVDSWCPGLERFIYEPV